MAVSTPRALFFTSLVVTFVLLVSISSIFIIHQHRHHSKIVYSNVSATLPMSFYGGGYTFNISLGSPTQQISLSIDTGSGPVWVPCLSPFTDNNCVICNSSGINFKPESSSSYDFVNCADSRCKVSMYTCDPINHYCHYQLFYGIGDTAGLLSTETLRVGNHYIPQFLVGCSTNSHLQLTGLAGFNNHPTSLPQQLRLRKFAYCLSSSGGGTLILGSSNSEVKGLSYTPFLTSSNPNYQQFYYVLLRSITVGDVRIDMPPNYILPTNYNDGIEGRGMVVDSGTTYMIMVSPIFDLVTSEFVKVLGDQYPPEQFPSTIGSKLCFSGLTQENSKIVPTLDFEFDGIGARMELPIENYFEFVDNLGCLTMYDSPTSKNKPFYAIILGNSAQQNFYIEYDIENKRLGFKPNICTL